MSKLRSKHVLSGRSGFTLIEVLLASMIGLFVALVAVGTLKAVSASGDLVELKIEEASQLRFAMRYLRSDLSNVYRGRGRDSRKFVGTLIDDGFGGFDANIVVKTICRVKSRAGQPESDIYEVEYYLQRDKDNSALMRRVWAYPDEESIPPGGVLSVVAENVDLFEARYFDGQQWLPEWPEDMSTLPELVEVRLAFISEDGKDPVTESILVNYARSTGIDSSGETTEESESSGGEG